MVSRVSREFFTIIRERPLRRPMLEQHERKLPLQVFSGNFTGVHESGDAAIGEDLTIAFEAPAKLGTSLLILRTKACVIGRARRFNLLRIRVGGRTGCKCHRGRNHC
jgi:hypothetical protein